MFVVVWKYKQSSKPMPAYRSLNKQGQSKHSDFIDENIVCQTSATLVKPKRAEI